MRTFIISLLFSFTSLVVCGQQLELPKASPFTAVKWEKEQPIVKFENTWYHFEKLEHFSKKEITDFCRTEYGDNWQKRFSEDLVEVLKGLGFQPNVKVGLVLSKNGVSEQRIGTFTFENRQLSLHYNKALLASKYPEKLPLELALDDLKEFEEILTTNSSYAQISSFNFMSAIEKLRGFIVAQKSDIDVHKFTHKLSQIMSEIGDRHSSVKNEAFHNLTYDTYNLKLPFGVTTVNGKIIATKYNEEDTSYTYYYNSHPFIQSIDGVFIDTLINEYNYKDKKAPTPAKLSLGSDAIHHYGSLLFKNNIACPDSVKVVFSDGSSERVESFQLTKTSKGYISKISKENSDRRKMIENKDFSGISSMIAPSIGYINIPEMYHYKEIKGLEEYIESALKSFSQTKSLIIDIRNNPGGTREILKTFANYLVPPEQSPWVANVAYVRTDITISGDEASMSARYLYSYQSDKLTDIDRNAIDNFNQDFKLEKAIDSSKFNTPFYMILHNKKDSYLGSVYLLVNEHSFSAASVFTSAFKSLPNVYIVGQTTDGSSGNSREFYLKNSHIKVKVSTMLSFQRNGKTLDQNGTLPDIVIPAEKTQVLKGNDYQLTKLVEIINGRK